MSNELFASIGVDVAELVAENLGPMLLPCVLIKAGAAGGRDPQNPTRVLPRGQGTRHTCRGFIESFSMRTVAEGTVKAGDRKVTLIANTIEGGVAPVGSPELDADRVTVEGSTWAIHSVISRDPAAATYVLQVRKPVKEPQP